MDDRTKAEKLAFTLRYLVDKGCIPGLLPKDVLAAADLLIEQERQLDTANKALTAKRHIVEATAEREHYRMKIRGTFIITDPRIYYGEIAVDDRTMFGAVEQDWELDVARHLARVATADWLREMEESAFVAVRTAIAAGSRSVRSKPERRRSRIAQP